MPRSLLIAIALSATVVLPRTFAAQQQDLAKTLMSNPNFSIVAQMLDATGLMAKLREDGPYTVFAPTNEAFAKLSPTTRDSLRQNPALLRSVLQGHIVPGRVLASQFGLRIQPRTVARSMVRIVVESGQPMFGSASIVAPDIQARNGLIHGVDTVLIPSGQ